MVGAYHLNQRLVRLFALGVMNMSKAEDLLAYLKAHVGEWACSMCGSHSGQPAAVFRNLKNEGWEFEEVKPQRWGKLAYCPICKQTTTHYKLKSLTQGIDKSRVGMTRTQRERVVSVLGIEDAFTGASVRSSLEIDHKVPYARLRESIGDINIDSLNNSQIAESFQVLTRDHNLLKDRACQKCIKYGQRPPFMGIEYWYEGDSKYLGSCEGCGFFDGTRWRQELNARLNWARQSKDIVAFK